MTIVCIRCRSCVMIQLIIALALPMHFIREWLKQKDHEWIHEAIDAIIRTEWQDLFVGPIQEQSKEAAAPAVPPHAIPTAATP